MKRADIVFMCALFLGALILRLSFVVPTNFDGLYGQDAYAYYHFAGELGDSLREGRTPEPFFWSLGYPVTLLVGFFFAGEHESTAQATSLIMGASLAPLTYALAFMVTQKRFNAIIAGLLMLLCGQAVQSSIVIMSDIPALFWTTASALALIRWRKNQQFRYLLISTMLLSFGGLTRWVVLVLAPVWVLVVLDAWQWRVNMRQSFVIFCAVGLIFLPQIAFSLNNPYPTLNHAFIAGWSPLNAFSNSFTTVEGQFAYTQTNARYYAQVYSDAYYLAPIFTPFIVLGMWVLWQNRARFVALMLILWAVLPYLFLVGIPSQNIRFPLIVTPAVFVLVGAGFGMIASIRRGRYAVYGGIIAVIMVGGWQMLDKTQGIVDQFVTNQQRDKAIAQWAIDQLPDDPRLYTFGLTLTLQHHSTMDVYEIYYETPQTLADAWISGQDDYLLLNVWQIENQWAGREPQIVYHWLRDERGLTQIDRRGNYTLFKVAG